MTRTISCQLYLKTRKSQLEVRKNSMGNSSGSRVLVSQVEWVNICLSYYYIIIFQQQLSGLKSFLNCEPRKLLMDTFVQSKGLLFSLPSPPASFNNPPSSSYLVEIHPTLIHGPVTARHLAPPLLQVFLQANGD